jgi:predicted small integral membrane protein
MSNTQTTSGGTNILGLLGVAFIVLKLVGIINWSWWWVLAPFWLIPALLVIVLLIDYWLE